MKALFTLESAKEYGKVLIAMFSLVFLIYPEAQVVATGSPIQGNTALVFEIKDPSLLQNKHSLAFETIVKNDPLVAKLREYLIKHKSPLADYSAEIIQQPQWQRALAISWVESNFGRRCADNNCSGIGVAPGHPSWRKYATKLDWFKDMCQLLEKPIYKEKYTTFEKMRGIYVYPGSSAWVYGAKTKYNELMVLEKEAIEEQQLAIHQAVFGSVAASGVAELEVAVLK